MTNTNEVTEVMPEQLSTHKPENQVKPKIGRHEGFEHLKPLNIEQFMAQHDCLNLLLEHPWVRELRLVSNPYMYRSLGRANFKTNTVELSSKALLESMTVQREVFIRSIAHFIADRLFSERGIGQAYKLIVSRYIKRTKGQSNSTGNVVLAKETEEA